MAEASNQLKHFRQTSFEALDIPGYGHLCFQVENIDAVLAELEQRGVPTFVPAETYPLSNYWRRVGFVLDNSGNVIEFAESLHFNPANKVERD